MFIDSVSIRKTPMLNTYICNGQVRKYMVFYNSVSIRETLMINTYYLQQTSTEVHDVYRFRVNP